MFILSGGGKLNYLGSKNWIEQQMEKSNTLQVNIRNIKILNSIYYLLILAINNVSGCVICVMFRLPR